MMNLREFFGSLWSSQGEHRTNHVFNGIVHCELVVLNVGCLSLLSRSRFSG